MSKYLKQFNTQLFFSSFILSIAGGLAGCQEDSPVVRSGSATDVSVPIRDADKLRIVECRLPPRIHALGSKITYAGARQAVQTSVSNCKVRGGEYVLFDPADATSFASTLNMWSPRANEGDREAQARLGEIYELIKPPDYEMAALWYKRAAQQDHSAAMVNLGHLYEKGLGVKKDNVKALNLYRQASGIEGELTFGGADVDELEAEVARLQKQVRYTEQDLRETERMLGKRDARVRELEQRLRELDQRIKADPGSAQSAEFEQTRDNLQVELGKLKQERADLQLRLMSSEQRLAEANRRLQERDLEVKALENQLRMVERRIVSAPNTGELERLAKEKAKLAAELENLKRDRNGLRQRIAKIETQQQPVKGPFIKVIFPPLDVTPTKRNLHIIDTLPGITQDVWGIVTASAGLRELTVNGKRTQPDANGLFHVQVPIAETDVAVKVKAVDRKELKKSVEFRFSPKKPSAPQEVVIRSQLKLGKYHALLIGNQDYENYPDLDTPINDVHVLAKVLKNRYGFESIKQIENADRLTLLSAFDKLRTTLTEQDNLLIYYAGHGQLVKDESLGFIKGYWLPVDARSNFLATWISNDDITAQIKLMRAKHVIVVADSCYSGTLTRSVIPQPKVGLTDRERIDRYQEMLRKRSRTVLTAGGVEPVFDSLGGQHSVFAKHFIDTLQRNMSVLEGLRLYEKVFKPVKSDAAKANVKQSPEYGPIKQAGHEATDFLLVPKELRAEIHPLDGRPRLTGRR